MNAPNATYHLERAKNLIGHAQDALYMAIAHIREEAHTDAAELTPLIRGILQALEPYTDGPNPASLQKLIRNIEEM